MNYFKIYIALLFFFISMNHAVGQDSLNSATVEQKSYQLYKDKNWSELITFGNKAIRIGFDYYYLQLRIGIAYFERKNYSLAEAYFRNALAFNTEDELSLEYLYYCYLYNGRNEDARLLSKTFNPSLADKIGTSQKSAVDFIIIEGGTKITDSSTYYNKIQNGKTNYFNPATYIQVGLNHHVKNRVSFFHAVTYFGQETSINKVKQYQYFLKASIPIKRNFLISSSFHYVKINVASEFTTTKVDTLYPPGVPPGSQPPPGAPPFKTETTTTSNTTNSATDNFVGSINVQKTLKKFVFGIGTTVSSLNKVTQYNHNGFLAYYLLGNSKLVLGCLGYIHTTNNYKTTNAAINPFVYIQPVNKLSLKLSYYYNSKNNVVEENGYLVNNSPDITTSKYSALINLNISKQVGLYALYQLENKFEGVQSFNYRYNVIVAGIKVIP